MNQHKGLNAYQSNQTRTRADVANPYQMVKILFENLLDNIARAKGAIEMKNPAMKAKAIGRCLDIINALRGALDHSINEEMTRNLDNLYLYANSQLTQASMKNDLEALDNAMEIIQPLKLAWEQLGGQEPGSLLQSGQQQDNPDAAA